MPDDLTRFWFSRYVPKPGDVIVDIGAGGGEELASYLSAVGPNGKVWMFEASADRFRNIPSAPNVERICCAMADHFGVAYLDGEGDAATISTEKGHPVPTVPLDAFTIPRVDLLKMNIEGAEKWALHGAINTLMATRHAVICAHDFRAARGEGEQYRTREFVENFLQMIGFKTETTPGWDHVHAWRTE